MKNSSKSFVLFLLTIVMSIGMIPEKAVANQVSSFELMAMSEDNVKLDKVDKVNANSTDVWKVTFYKGNSYKIYVNGDDDTDLDLYVYDENDNLVASDTDNLDLCICNVTPKWTGEFKIKIKNLGDVYNKYHFKITYK